MNATETAQRSQLTGPYKEVAETEVSSETVFLLAAQAGDCWWLQAVSYDLHVPFKHMLLGGKKKNPLQL